MEKKYYPTVGLEIHAELKTKTKMFCACKNDPDEETPNKNVCPVCMAHPGTLPVPNKKAIENVIRVGLAVGGNIADFTEFDRKNYFYPDIPKGYQISQYKYPIVSGGHLANFELTRIHLEEDTANNKHLPAQASDKEGFSLIDFNRAGVPLMELVTEPNTFENDDEAAKSSSKFAKELQLILWYLGVSDANMEKGEMRVEANISVSDDKSKYGTKVEVKNLNSFKSVEKAIKYEVDRMIELIKEGKIAEIVQETRGWDETNQKTFSQRKKESSHDYRYFPDPDLPKMKLYEAFDLEKMKSELPELPNAKRERYKKDFGIKDEDIESYINDIELGTWFEEIVESLNNLSPKERKILEMYYGLRGESEMTIQRISEEFGVTKEEIINIKNKSLAKLEYIKKASNFITTDYIGIKKNNLKIKFSKPENIAELINMFVEKKISSRSAKDILAMIVVNDESPMKIAERENLLQKSDKGELIEIVKKIIDQNPKIVDDYKGGKENALMFLLGQIMKETKGSANPEIAKQVLTELLK